MNKQKLLSLLPSVDEILKSKKGSQWQEIYPRRYVLKAIREIIEEKRQAILRDELKEISIEAMLPDIEHRVERLSSFSLKPVINATGVVVHTNLGRSVLSEEILENVKRVACGYSNLEYDLEKGERGKRYWHVQMLLNEITGAESSLIVNNNAAAVFVCLSALAKGKEVIVSRGELVEIGGSFRVPDVMASSGAILREVGTTNKTHLYDYENAINEDTGLLLKVHQSNFRTIGFTKLVGIEELVNLGRTYNIPVMFDLGSGCLMDLRPYGIYVEPTVHEIIKSGCDIVTFSGDKLLGGPQGGIIVGRSELIEKIAKNPLMRAVRIDKLTLSAFEAVLMHYLDEEKAKKEIPTLRMLLQDINEIRARAKKIATRLHREIKDDVAKIEIVEDSSQSGGGALPEVEFKTFVITIKPENLSVNHLQERLRHGNPPVIVRIKEDNIILDVRTVRDIEIKPLVKVVSEALL
ncbi:L-seryl-tRNA(Sec) selenium transferase [Dissulfurispira thermophila]|uniref:L-seryl-tRNA(Sec) selenium transferase n=2 Tax=root TaxID=1 RepID=A0A7G1GYN6_9BACT|nr:L-seryl-tRNA(Sec) selenium transferase [Dissulfurispira thermophila]BCB95099.1 L-seryl-tRNA(Sec) selenium transferase [Dissulfurispira thermophila]